MYFTDRGIEELEKRRGEEEVTFEWLAEQLRDVRRPQPRLRGAGGAAGDLAGPTGRRGRRTSRRARRRARDFP